MNRLGGNGGREQPRSIVLHEGDASDALDLSAEAGWNQTKDDWRLLLRSGTGTGIRDESGRLVASIVTVEYGQVGWLAMLLVRMDSRGSGFGTRLLEDALRGIEETGRTAALDATPQGRNIYERYGFRALFELERFSLSRAASRAADAPQERSAGPIAGLSGESPAMPAHPDLLRVDMLPEMIARDIEVLGFDRSGVLPGIAGRITTTILVDREDPDSFVLLRPGRTAWQIGPLYARTAAGAKRLMQAGLRRHPEGTVFIDIPAGQSEFRSRLEAAGFRNQRSFTRMVRDSSGPFGLPHEIFAITGPEFG